MPQSTTWDRRLYFPSEGRHAEDFFALKNPTASAGFETATLGTKGQHATPRPPKPIPTIYNSQIKFHSYPPYYLSMIQAYIHWHEGKAF